MVLFIYLIIYFLLVFVIRSLVLYRRTGVKALTFTTTDDAHGFNGKVFAFVLVIELVVVGIYAFKFDWYAYLLPFWYLEYALLRSIGWGFLILSFIWVWIAQSQMAQSWRIGIDKEHKIQLITTGLFSRSRNPIFMGIIVTNIGLFLIIPNAFTLLILLLSTISINTQVRLEEDFLKSEFGQEYDTYRSKVRRWL